MPALAELASAPFEAIVRVLQADQEDPAAAIRRDLQNMRATETQAAVLREILP